MKFNKTKIKIKEKDLNLLLMTSLIAAVQNGHMYLLSDVTRLTIKHKNVLTKQQKKCMVLNIKARLSEYNGVPPEGLTLLMEYELLEELQEVLDEM